MSKSRDALGLVLTGLRELLAEGAIAPGAQVSITDVAARFRVSVTPVREALSRLVGEGVLRSTRRFGYERALLRAEELRQLYAFREMLLLAAVRAAGQRPPLTAGAGGAAELFEAWVGLAANEPLARAYANTVLLLAPATVAEADVLGDLTLEHDALREACAEADSLRLEEAVRELHARRCDVAAQLAERLRPAKGRSPRQD